MTLWCNFGLVAMETWELWTRSQLSTESQRMGAERVALLQGLILLSMWCKTLGTGMGPQSYKIRGKYRD